MEIVNLVLLGLLSLTAFVYLTHRIFISHLEKYPFLNFLVGVLILMLSSFPVTYNLLCS